MKFRFPLSWWLDRNYRSVYRMTKKEERDCWDNLITSNGFLQAGEKPYPPSTLLIFTRKSLNLTQIQTSWSCCMRTCNWIVGGRWWALKLPFFPYSVYPFPPIFSSQLQLNIYPFQENKHELLRYKSLLVISLMLDFTYNYEIYLSFVLICHWFIRKVQNLQVSQV